jgi:hypothetical protein
MRRALISLGIALAIVSVATLIFLALEPAVGPAFPFWPGLAIQWLLDHAGIGTTNRILPWASVMFWWFAIWVALGMKRRWKGEQAA